MFTSVLKYGPISPLEGSYQSHRPKKIENLFFLSRAFHKESVTHCNNFGNNPYLGKNKTKLKMRILKPHPLLHSLNDFSLMKQKSQTYPLSPFIFWKPISTTNHRFLNRISMSGITSLSIKRLEKDCSGSECYHYIMTTCLPHLAKYSVDKEDALKKAEQFSGSHIQVFDCIKGILENRQFQENPSGYTNDWIQRRHLINKWTILDTAGFFFEKYYSQAKYFNLHAIVLNLMENLDDFEKYENDELGFAAYYFRKDLDKNLTEWDQIFSKFSNLDQSSNPLQSPEMIALQNVNLYVLKVKDFFNRNRDIV